MVWRREGGVLTMRFVKYFLAIVLSYSVCFIGVCYAGKLTDPISNHNAEIFNSKVRLDLMKDKLSLGDLSYVLPIEKYNHVTKDGNLYGFVAKYTNRNHTAMILYQENEEKQLVSISVLPIDSSDDTYADAVLLPLKYILLNIGFEMEKVKDLLSKSVFNDKVESNCKAINKKIVLYRLEHTDGDKIPTYHIITNVE